MRPSSPVLFITGINRGLGRATALLALRRGYEVVGTVRSEQLVSDTEAALRHDAGDQARLRVLVLDGHAPDQMPNETRAALEHADILVNNLGTGADLAKPETRMATLDEAVLLDAIQVNALAAHRLTQAALPHMVAQGWGRVVNVSSARSTLGTITGDILVPSYRLSKLLLNGVTVLTAEENRDSGVLINCLCPGWCKTAMGGPTAPDTPEMGAERIMALVELPDGGPTGKLFIDGEVSEF